MSEKHDRWRFQMIRLFSVSAACLFFITIQSTAQERWIQYTNGNYINCLVCEGDYVWAGTQGGAVKWNRMTGEYVKYTTLSGLVDNVVNSAAIDSRGNMWFGTWGGVSKFDGHTWTTYTDENGLAANFVNAIAIEPGKGAWFGTSRGVTLYDGLTWTTFTTDHGLSYNNVTAIAVDAKGHVWVGTSKGLSKFDGKNWKSFTNIAGGGNIWVTSIVVDDSGNVWVCLYGGVSVFGGSGWTYYKESDGLLSNWVQAAVIDTEGNIWFATGGGVNRFDGENWKNYTSVDGIAHNDVKAITIDSDGDVWCGTSEGLSRFDGNSCRTWTTEDPVSGYSVNNIISDNTGNVWIAPVSKGLQVFNGSTWIDIPEIQDDVGIDIDQSGDIWTLGRTEMSKFNGIEWTKYIFDEEHRYRAVPRSIKVNNGKVWCSQGDGGLSCFDGESWSHYGVQDGLAYYTAKVIEHDRKGNMWFGTSRGVSRFDGSNWTTFSSSTCLLNNTVTSLYADVNDNIWVGTVGGISKYDGKQWSSYPKEEMPFDRTVSVITGDSEGNIWCAHSFEGVCCFDGTNWTAYTTSTGLANNYINDMIVDAHGNVWICTAGGISVLQKDAEHYTDSEETLITFRLRQNYPNPFNPSTIIPYRLERAGHTTLAIYNSLGQRVRTLVNGPLPAGSYTVRWDGRNGSGVPVPSGVYFYRLKAGGFDRSMKMLLVR